MSVFTYPPTNEQGIFRHCTKECGIITSTQDQQYFALGCMTCSEKFLYFNAFIEHMQTMHASLANKKSRFRGGDEDTNPIISSSSGSGSDSVFGSNNNNVKKNRLIDREGDNQDTGVLEPTLVIFKEEKIDYEGARIQIDPILRNDDDYTAGYYSVKHEPTDAEISMNPCYMANSLGDFNDKYEDGNGDDMIKHDSNSSDDTNNGKKINANGKALKYNNTQGLLCHKKVVNNLQKKHVCSFCSKSFIWKSLLKRHLRVHNKQCPYSCPFCTKKFKDNRDLNTHQQICDRNTQSFTFYEKTHKHDADLCKHLVLNTEKPVEKNDILKKHQEIHLKDEPNANNKDSLENSHICKFCFKTFYFESLLKYHLRVHTGERPYSCSVCNRTYIHQKDLNKHNKKVHNKISNVKDLSCKY